MSANDGGPAFPHWDGPSGECFNGMTLRDYFAAAALRPLLGPNIKDDWPRSYARWAYELADAMLEERAK